MTRYVWVIFSSFVVVCLVAGTSYLCGPDFTFREYLDKRFWQPFAKYEDSVVKPETAKAKKSEPQTTEGHFAFAGYSTAPAREVLSRVRKAYIDGSYERARNELAAAEKADLADTEKEELRLIDAKLDLRLAESDARNEGLLRSARLKLESFLGTAKIPSFRSEARGWLARVHFLLGDYPAAVKMYLDELTMKESVFDRESLVNSLHTIFKYNGSDAGLVYHLEDYFDTPAHALFIVYIVTNPIYSRGEERAAMSMVAQNVIQSLQKHSELFNGSDLSDSLALALMRASIYMGDTGAALAYSKKIVPNSKTADTPEFNWMVGACHFLQREYAEAEAPLLKIVQSKEASPRELRAATRGLIGVYQKLGRRVEQLHAAFLYEKLGGEDQWEPSGFGQYAMYLPEWEWLLDTPYLLDIQLSDDELREYLVRYEKEARQIKYPPFGFSSRKRTAFEAVEYELAVRLARQEKYNESAKIYERLNARPRAERVRILAALYGKTIDFALPAEERLKAKFEYASFLEAHSTQVFFNDMIWRGFQTWTFVGGKEAWSQGPYVSANNAGSQGLTGEERESFAKDERRVQDEQEERWRAYQILMPVIGQAGYTELGKAAAIKAIRCLDLIAVQRFGRLDEINKGRQKLLTWLRDYRRNTRKDKVPTTGRARG